MHHFAFHAPRDWGELLSLRETEGSQVIAGGTDLLPLMRSRQLEPRLLIDLQWVPNLRYIRSEDGLMEIGSTTTHADLARSPLCANHAPLLADAARSGGSSARAHSASPIPTTFQVNSDRASPTTSSAMEHRWPPSRWIVSWVQSTSRTW